MSKKRLPRKLKKLNRKNISKFAVTLPKVVLESIKTAIALSQLMRTMNGVHGEYARERIRETYPMPEPKYPVGGWVMAHEIPHGQEEFVIRDGFKNHTILPVIERIRNNSLEAKELDRVTELLRGSFGVVEPDFVRVNSIV